MSFRREKHVPKGGPDGGNGGRGGHIILRGNAQLWTLLHLRYRKHVIAANGARGEGGRRSGADGEDVILEVPLGTIARDAETGNQIIEITENGDEQILTAGGRGGLGNENFKTSTNQAPRHAQPGAILPVDDPEAQLRGTPVARRRIERDHFLELRRRRV